MTEDARTFRFDMRDIPVVEVVLQIIEGHPPGLGKTLGVDLDAMTGDLLFRVLEGQRRAFERHLDTPMGPEMEPPEVEVDLDKPEAIALAHLLIAVREGQNGEFERLLLRVIGRYFVQIPDEWAESANAPLPSLVAAVKKGNW